MWGNMMDAEVYFNAKLTQVRRLLGKAEYPDSATRCMLVIEQALRQIAARYIERVDDKVKQNVLEGVRKRRQKTLDKLTMGQMVYVFQESGFLDACARTTGKDLSSLSIINLDKLTQLRNKIIHNAQEATQTEAEFLLHCLRIILETFDLQKPINNDAVKRTNITVEGNITMATPPVPFALQQRIIEFLLTLPALNDSPARQAFLNSAGLDPQLQQRIRVADPPSQFFHLLVPMLSQYGTLEDGRHALQAVLETAQQYVGQEGAGISEQLLRELRNIFTRTPAADVPSEIKPMPVITPPVKSTVPKESLDTQILRVLAEYYQQHPGDPEMDIADVLNALPEQPMQRIQIELFALKKKGWISYELTTEGNAGLVWIEPRGIKITRANR